MDRLGKVYLCFVRETEAKGEFQAPGLEGSYHSTIALDPGVRTFQTVSDADGRAIEWGNGDMAKVFVLCRQADHIQSKLAKKKGGKTALRRAYLRKLQCIKNKITECHRKLALWLCEKYRCVLIPNFETPRMINRITRKIRGKTYVRTYVRT